jgi:serine/threonine protein kinase
VASTGSDVFSILLFVWRLPAQLILSKCQHVALKLFVDSKSLGIQHLDEINIYKHIENSSSKDHPGRSAIRLLLDSFNVEGPDGQQYQCLVHPPLWESIVDIRHRNPIQKLPEQTLAFVLKRLFQALDFLHTECHVVHTDIKLKRPIYCLRQMILCLEPSSKRNSTSLAQERSLTGEPSTCPVSLAHQRSSVRQCSVTLDQLCDSTTGFSTRKTSSPTSTDHQKPS